MRRDDRTGDLADEALVRAAQAGDAGAFAQLMQRHHKAIAGYLTSLGASTT